MNSKDKPYAWAMPFITGKIYNIWWSSGIDWTHLAVESNQYEEWEKAIIFKFNNTEQR